MTRTIEGFYGRGTLTDIIVCDMGDDTSWYVCKGSINVSQTFTNSVMDGVDVEALDDMDSFTNDVAIMNERDLYNAISTLEYL